jgi:hypothetical protein
MSIESRLSKLENQIGTSDSATCDCSDFSHEIRTYTDAEDNHAAAQSDERPPEVCDVCGRPKDIIQIVVVHSPDSCARTA